ncbi:agmatinase [Streptomyces sp. 3MP-14]|uniref:Agmatinase n=1 Tax=Streptomyces mimosae TaxID=2586635 RepID=A0A5N6A0E0_9ACTN|nr:MULTISPECIES: agmatinase [Streptomyces]KAB8162227.1 agmatinase [Streptomyces mimosae]KAB8173874.1 agmatinase [Streptomyces sp. 3MP-14]
MSEQRSDSPQDTPRPSDHGPEGHAHGPDGHHHHHHDFGEGFWAQPPRLGRGLEGHGAVDDFNVGRPPGPIFVNRKGEGGFAGIQTFAKLPVCLTPEDLVAGEIDVAICGVPWDATASGRSGTNHGPLAIRACDYKGGYGRPHYSLDVRVDAFETLRVCDYGDAPIRVGNTWTTFEEIRKFVGTIVDSGAVPIILGGDHATTWPSATALADHYGYGKVGIVHFDAHADTGTDTPGSLASHGTPMRKLIESGAVPGKNFVQVGLRGYWPDQETIDWMEERQMRTHFMAEINRDGFEKVLERAVDEALDQADHLYISLDIDVADPAYAPGTGTPEPGGLTSIHVLTAVRRLAAEVGIVGMDVVEVSPPYDDRGEITALLANRAVREALTGIAMRRKGLTEPDYLHPGALGPGHSRALRDKG